MKPIILILEKDPIIAANLVMQFKKWGYTLFGIFDNEVDAFLAIASSKVAPDLIIMNLYHSNTSSPFLMIRLLHFLYHIPLLIITGLRKKEITPLLPKKTTSNVLYKPYSDSQLKQIIAHQFL